jgi:arylsulfatase A-like enzyme
VQALPKLTRKAVKSMTATYRARLETLQSLDELVRDVTAAIDALGIADRTVVMFTSDNGWFQGEHRIQAGKVAAYDEAHRLPLLIRGPGFAPGDTNTVAWLPDIAVTIAAMAGVTLPHPDGLDLRSLPRGRVVGVEAIKGTSNPGPAFAGARAETWSYTLCSTGEEEYYDLVADPYQLVNLPVPDGIRELVAPLSACAGGSCAVFESPPPTTTTETTTTTLP